MANFIIEFLVVVFSWDLLASKCEKDVDGMRSVVGYVKMYTVSSVNLKLRMIVNLYPTCISLF